MVTWTPFTSALLACNSSHALSFLCATVLLCVCVLRSMCLCVRGQQREIFRNSGAIGFASGTLLWMNVLKIDLLIWGRSCLVQLPPRATSHTISASQQQQQQQQQQQLIPRTFPLNFTSIRPESSLTAGEPHMGSYTQDEPLCSVLPLFNLGQPRDFKSMTSRRGTLYVYV